MVTEPTMDSLHVGGPTADYSGQKLPDTTRPVQPVSVTFTGKAAAQIQELALRKKIDVGAAVQSTLALGQAIDAALDEGASLGSAVGFYFGTQKTGT